MDGLYARNRKTKITGMVTAAALVLGTVMPAQAQSDEEMHQRINRLEQELEQARMQLAEAEKQKQAAQDAQTQETAAPDKITFGPLKIGGAMRVNYVLGDYDSDHPIQGDAPSRGAEGGNFELDTFRLNFDYECGNWVGKGEYRWYDGYNFLHTGWIGYNFDDGSQIQAGVNRVPFGPGPYGVSQSWLFDQHYYVGLSDDMDLGVKYTKPMDDWTLDFAYYVTGEGDWRGDSSDSARYSYDVVDRSGDGYEERHQFNVRAVYNIEGEIATDLGASLQYGQLESNGSQDDGDHFAGSLHSVSKWNSWTLASQLTYYNYDVDDAQPNGTDDLVQFGAYDFPTLVASEAVIPAVSLSYYYETADIAWLDYVVPYVEYSSIVKSNDDFNNSEMVVLGSAWARGGWYIYTDLAFSNGNDFVGGDAGYGDPLGTPNNFVTSNRFGANPTDEWETRFNINLGYYF